MIYDTLFPALPAHARLWIYAVDAPLDTDTELQITVQLERFMNDWHSHGRKVHGEFTILYNRFILIAADIPDAEISGCGIDASVRALEETGRRLGFSLLSGLEVFYRDADKSVKSVPRPDFRKLVRSSSVSSDTSVFDTSLTNLAEIRNGQFELPAHASWHATVFRIPSPAN